MAIRVYHDFILLADDVKRGQDNAVVQFHVRVFDSPVGQGEREETVRVPKEIVEPLRMLERRHLDTDLGAQISLGETLAGMLLPPYARELFKASLSRLPADEGLRLRLRMDNALADLPWEYAYIDDRAGDEAGPKTANGFLMLDPRIALVRHEAVHVPGDWFTPRPRRRIVVAMASPEGEPVLTHLPTEQRRLKEVLRAIPGVTAVFMPEYASDEAVADRPPPSTTLTDLLGALATSEPTDIFHFAGHARFRRQSGPFQPLEGTGEIVMADEQGRALALPANGLVELLRGKGTRLVVLGACEGGRRDGRNPWSSVATALVKAGIPAVIAMQYTVDDGLAAVFSGALYQALVAGLSIEEAVTLARLAMRASARGRAIVDIRDWGVPVLYLRASGGPVFNPVSDAAVRDEAEQRVRSTVEQEVRTVESTGRLIGAVVGDLVEGSMTIQQKVEESVDGLMIGGAFVTMQGGQLTVKQTADTVRDTMIGLRVHTVGGGQITPSDAETTLQGIERRLGVERYGIAPSSPFCRSCGTKFEETDRFCGKCGTSRR